MPPDLPPMVVPDATIESMPPQGPVPVISVSPGAQEGQHVISLAPGARIVQDAPPASAGQRAVELAPVLLAMVVCALWGALQPTLIPILVGLLTTALAFAYRKRPAARELAGGGAPVAATRSARASPPPTPVPPVKGGSAK